MARVKQQAFILRIAEVHISLERGIKGQYPSHWLKINTENIQYFCASAIITQRMFKPVN